MAEFNFFMFDTNTASRSICRYWYQSDTVFNSSMPWLAVAEVMVFLFTACCKKLSLAFRIRYRIGRAIAFFPMLDPNVLPNIGPILILSIRSSHPYHWHFKTLTNINLPLQGTILGRVLIILYFITVIVWTRTVRYLDTFRWYSHLVSAWEQKKKKHLLQLVMCLGDEDISALMIRSIWVSWVCTDKHRAHLALLCSQERWWWLYITENIECEAE